MSKRKPNYIPGIYNYCDAWCERCPFTERCRNYAMQQAMHRQLARQDRENAKFWAAMEKTLGDALNDIAQQVESLEPPQPEQPLHRQLREEDRPLRKHPLALDSLQYIRSVENWFRAHPREVPSDSPLADPTAVIGWYVHFIHVKLCRALSGLPEFDEFADEEEGEQWKGEDDDYPKDSDGSAKIAIIAIERSISAWSHLRDHFPADSTRIKKTMTHLARLRALADQTFPNARSFHRPGFDD